MARPRRSGYSAAKVLSSLPLSREFALAAACCRWPPSTARDAAVRHAVGSGIDWPRFLRVLARQRVEGLAKDAFARAEVDAPAAVRQALASEATGIARDNLAFAAECVRLHKLFQRAEITHLFVKGVTLDSLAYGTLAVKRSRDIDLAVSPETVDRACGLVEGAGYRRMKPGPGLSDEGFRTWNKLNKESIWMHAGSGIIVEIHHGFVDNPALLPGVSAHSSPRMVTIAPGIALPTLQKDELFSYLCVHGATHAWSRLKWIADVAAFLKDDDDAEIDRLFVRSLQLGVGRCSAQALLLCAALFERTLPGGLKARLEADPVNRWLVRVAIRTMDGRGEAELDDTMLGTVPIHLSHFALARGWRYKAGELARKFRSPYDQATLPLPRPLRFLYPIMLVPRWLWRRARSAP